MRVTVLAVGSRGDVEPFLALAEGLLRAGHHVCFATHAEFAPLVGATGCAYAVLPGDPRAGLTSPAGQALLATRNPAALPGRVTRLLAPALIAAAAPAEQACADADLVLASTLALVAPTAADLAGAPLVWGHLQPSTPTAAFASATVPSTRDLPRRVNRLSWTLTEEAFWRGVRGVLVERRRQLGLARFPAGRPSRWPGTPAPVLYGYSTAVVPRPPDWPEHVHVTGYWTRPAAARRAAPEVGRFLAAGPPPVYVGFGSMPDAEPAGLTALLLEALRLAGLRAVLLSGWSDLRPRDSTTDLLVVDEVPHDWLFPRVAAVVHHGGAGTTAAGLRAGAPSVLVPFFADQFFWGRRVAALRVGPPPLPRARLTATALATALRIAVRDQRMRDRARRIAARLATEDGVATAVRVLERVPAR